MFAASQTKRFCNIEHVAGYYYVLKRCVVSDDIRLSNPCSCCSSAITVSWSRWEAIAFLIFICIHISLNMTKRNEICNAGNNSTRTATSTHETGKYSNPELQAAYDAGRAIGRTEGMLSYQKHLMNQLFNENQKLNQKLQEQKGGSL